MELEYKTLGFEIKEITEDGRINGLAAAYGNVDFGGDVIEKGAFEQVISEGKNFPMLWSHDANEPIGLWDSMTDSAKGLVVGGKLLLTIQRAKDVYQLAKEGIVKGLSIGYRVADYAYETRKEQTVRIIKKIYPLFEVSPVVLPMNPKAIITGVKQLSTPRDMERFLHDRCGFSRSQAKALAGGFDYSRLRDVDDTETEPRDVETERKFAEVLEQLNMELKGLLHD